MIELPEGVDLVVVSKYGVLYVRDETSFKFFLEIVNKLRSKYGVWKYDQSYTI